MIPLNLRIKRKMHKDIAYAQDIIVEQLYNFLPEAVIHGGTAIWRCYNGNRFSEDIDIYIEKDKEKLNELFKNLEKKGFKLVKRRIKENSLYSELEFNDISVRLEAIFKKVKFIIKEYETSESNFLNVYTLSPEALVIEKVQTYLKRRKIRDLYDIFFLLRYVPDKSLVAEHINKLLKEFVAPENETNLQNIIMSGPVPSLNQMLEYIKRWEK